MGNFLGYPPKLEADRRQKYALRASSSVNNLQGTRPSMLPYSSFSLNSRSHRQDTEASRVPDTMTSHNTSHVEVETMKVNSNNSSRASSFNRESRYIKRYRNEEDKLIDMLQEREAVIRSAIKQGQGLRAKCTRYKDELDSLKALSDVDMTDVEWKKRYNELDKRNRDLKEELDVLAARNRNGNDHLQQQSHVIQELNSELQHEKIEKQRLLSSSLSSLQSVGVKDKKGKLMITQLEVDNRLLQERLKDLTVRNKHGRSYLSKLEAEKRDQDEMLAHLQAQLMEEKSENENLQTKVSIMTSTHNLYEIESTAESPSDIYAQVQRCKTSLTNKDEDNVRTIGRPYDYETVVNHIESTDAHMGFEIDNTDTNLNQNKVQSQVYEEIGFGDEQDNRNEEPYITTYVMNTNSSTDTTGSGNITSSTPRVDDSLISTDPEPVWDNIPESGELDVEHVTTRF